MDRRAELKSELRATIPQSLPDGAYEDAVHDRLHALVDELVTLTPTPRPVDCQEFIAAPWALDYARFGPRHTAGKPIRHIGKLSHHSFNLFPAIDVLQHEISQEIRVEGAHYNNIMEFATADGVHRCRRIVWGRYRVEDDEPQRYHVSFYAVELVPPEGVSPDELRAQFGFDADMPLYKELKLPRLHSDIVYCDDDMRINFGVMGGVYVMHRLHEPGKSVAFA